MHLNVLKLRPTEFYVLQTIATSYAKKNHIQIYAEIFQFAHSSFFFFFLTYHLAYNMI